MEAAFCSAERVTMAGSIPPAVTRFLVITGYRVEADTVLAALDLVDYGPFHAGVIGDRRSG